MSCYIKKLNTEDLEVLYDIISSLDYWHKEVCDYEFDSRLLAPVAGQMAAKFQADHRNTDWQEVDYVEAMDIFINKHQESFLPRQTRMF